ncbi:TonB-dependent receptor [Sphingomonas populi]|uniref:TonB-dependent receptor n=2 Tax=Sphingomonas populi TaxID=2484750 RepID=A0A4Q6XVY6_9SPHN|nr:TonB-dependent receptor [Sphingomonas populi]
MANSSPFAILNQSLPPLASPCESRSSRLGITFDISSALTLYAQGLYTYNRTRAAQNYPTAVPALSIPATNPFIPADLQALLASRANPTANFSLSKRFEEIPKRYYDEPLYTYQALIGAKGKLTDAINFDVYASHDQTINNETLTSALRLSRLNTLLRAADGGKSICAGGYNPFSIAGSASISPACLSYITTAVHNRLSVKQDVVEGTISGKLFRLPADDIRFSLTGSYRRNSLSYNADPLLLPLPGTPNTDLSATPASRSTFGSTNVKEIAGELLVPILKDLPFAKSLNLSLGYRYSDYNVSGGVSTYKAEADYTPVPGLLFRGGYEHAIRAPNIGELYSAPAGSIVTLGSAPSAGDPCDVRYRGRTSQLRALCIAQGIPASVIDTYAVTAVSVQATVSGNANLRPEIADTFTAGMVIAPRFGTPLLSHLSLSVDYYNIKINGAISPLPGAAVVGKCYNLDGSNPTYDPKSYYCSLIQRDASVYSLNNINTPYLNLGGYRTSGIDTQVDLRWELAELGLGGKAGSLTFTTVVSYQNDFRVQTLPGQAFQDFAGTIGTAQSGVGGFNPQWRALTSFTYRRSAGEIGIRWRWIDRMNDTTAVTSPASVAPGVPSYNSFDLVGRYRINENLEFRGGVTNFTDVSPPAIGGVAGQTNAGAYDIIGRTLYLGAHVKF